MYTLDELLNDFVIPASQPASQPEQQTLENINALLGAYDLEPELWAPYSTSTQATGAITASTSTQATNAITRALAANEYASDYLQTDLEQLGGRVLLHASTGAGKNRAMLLLAKTQRVIVVLHTQIALRQQYAESQRLGVKTARQYQHAHDTIDSDTRLILTTPESLQNAINAAGGLAGWVLAIDEYHQLGYAGYRSKAWRMVDTMAKRPEWARVIYMTGTPTHTPAGCDVLEYSKPRQQPYAVDAGKEPRIERAIRDLLAWHKNRTGAAIVYLNDKGPRLAQIGAALTAGDITWRAINSDQPDNVAELAEQGIVAGVDVIIGTAILEESISLHQPVDLILCLETLTEHQHQQLAARARSGAAKYIMYIGAEQAEHAEQAERCKYEQYTAILQRNARIASQQLCISQQALAGGHDQNSIDIATMHGFIAYDADARELYIDSAILHNATTTQYKRGLRDNAGQLDVLLASYGWVLEQPNTPNGTLNTPNGTLKKALKAGKAASRDAKTAKLDQHANACDVLAGYSDLLAATAQQHTEQVGALLERVASGVANGLEYHETIDLYRATGGARRAVQAVNAQIKMAGILRVSQAMRSIFAQIAANGRITANDYRRIVGQCEQGFSEYPIQALRIGYLLASVFHLQRKSVRARGRVEWQYTLTGAILPAVGAFLESVTFG